MIIDILYMSMLCTHTISKKSWRWIFVSGYIRSNCP